MESKLAKKNILGVNLSKDKLVLFMGKYKAFSFELPFFGSITLELSKEEKYLGII